MWFDTEAAALAFARMAGRVGGVRRDEVVRRLGLSRYQWERMVEQAREAGLVVRSGWGRTARYRRRCYVPGGGGAAPGGCDGTNQE